MRLNYLPVFIIPFLTGFLIITTAGFGIAGVVIDADLQFDYAQSRFEDAAYDEAVIEFNRFIYFFPTDERVTKANFQIGMAHFNNGRYKDAIPVFNRMASTSSDETLIADIYLMLSRCHAGLGQIDLAMVDLRNLMAVSSDPVVVDRAQYELAWLFIDQGRWKEAEDAMNRITTDNADRFHVEEVKRDLSQSDQIPSKNPTAAGFFSILPGAGQAYCGRYKDAVTAFLVNAGLIWATWEAFDNELYALGSVIGFVGFGFYAGNIYGAVGSAHKYNRKRNNEFRDHLIQKNRIRVSLGPVPGGLLLGLSLDF